MEQNLSIYLTKKIKTSVFKQEQSVLIMEAIFCPELLLPVIKYVWNSFSFHTLFTKTLFIFILDKIYVIRTFYTENSTLFFGYKKKTNTMRFYYDYL